MAPAVATFKLSQWGARGIRTVCMRSITPADRPEPSAPSQSAMRGGRGVSLRRLAPDGDKAVWSKPDRASAPMMLSASARAKGTRKAAPTDTRTGHPVASGSG